MDRELPCDYTEQEVHEYESGLVRERDIKLQGAGFCLSLSNIIQTLQVRNMLNDSFEEDTEPW